MRDSVCEPKDNPDFSNMMGLRHRACPRGGHIKGTMMPLIKVTPAACEHPGRDTLRGSESLSWRQP